MAVFWCFRTLASDHLPVSDWVRLENSHLPMFAYTHLHTQASQSISISDEHDFLIHTHSHTHSHTPHTQSHSSVFAYESNHALGLSLSSCSPSSLSLSLSVLLFHCVDSPCVTMFVNFVDSLSFSVVLCFKGELWKWLLFMFFCVCVCVESRRFFAISNQRIGHNCSVPASPSRLLSLRMLFDGRPISLL